MSRWRFLVQRATTGQWLHTDLPLRRTSGPTWELSGVGSLRGTLAPDLGASIADDGRPLLEEWSSLVYAEVDGRIRWGGIVVHSTVEGQTWEVEVASFATYLHGIPYGGDYSQIGVDPADVVAHLWAHVQRYPDGDLGVVVTGDKTTARLGTPASGDDEAEPYALAWWDSPDIGAEVDALATSTPFDFVEEHEWDDDSVAHRIRIAYPRAGRRRDDLAFIHGDNVVSIDAPQRDGDRFANEVVGIGAGEGTGSIRTTSAVRDGRLRRPYVYEAKDVGNKARLSALVRDELTTRQQALTIPAVDVIDHANAPIGSWSLGDDVRIQARLPWLGDVDIWHRVTGWELTTDTTARLYLERSDAYTYGG